MILAIKFKNIVFKFVLSAVIYFLLSSTAFASSIILAWDKPEGSIITGYNLYYGLLGTDYKINPGKTINSANQTDCIIDNLEPGKVYVFAATSVGKNGNESDYSKEIIYEVPLYPYTIETDTKTIGTGSTISSFDDIFFCDKCSTNVESDNSKSFSIEPDDASFSLEEYTVTATAGIGGVIDPSGEFSVKYGDSLTFIIKPSAGYKISNITVNGFSVGPVNTYTVNDIIKSTTITAMFSLNDEAVGISKLPPEKPIILKPMGFAELFQEKTITLETEPYFHPEDIAHQKSHWKIRRFDGNEPFYDVISEVDLTNHEVEVELIRGLKYIWQVGFQGIESELVSWSDKRSFVVGETKINDQILPIEPGSSIFDYKMISFSHWTQSTCSKKVFEPLLGKDYNYNYRILAYDPKIDQFGGYRQLGDFDVVPGKAYWVLARNGLDLTMEGIPVTTTSDIFVPLGYNATNNNGWSMIAPPNNASYLWGNVEIIVYDDSGEILYGPLPIKQLSKNNPYIDPRIWEWRTGISDKYIVYDSNNFKLKPHGGYWIKARSENVYLSFPYDAQENSSNPDILISKLVDTNSEYDTDSQSYIDEDKPPMPMAGLDESFNSSDGQKKPEKKKNKLSHENFGCFIDSIVLTTKKRLK